MFYLNIKKIVLLLLLISITGSGYSYSKNQHEVVSSPELSKLIKSSAGDTIILYYWATWCSGCRPSLKVLADLQKKYKDQDLKVIAVSVDGTKDELKLALVKFLYDQSGEFFAPLISKDGRTKEVMTVVDNEWLEIVPVSYLISKKGKVLHRFVGNKATTKLKNELKLMFNKP